MEVMKLKAGAVRLEEVFFYALSVYETLQNVAQNDGVKLVRPDGQVQELKLRPPRVITQVDGVDFNPDSPGTAGTVPVQSEVQPGG